MAAQKRLRLTGFDWFFFGLVVVLAVVLGSLIYASFFGQTTHEGVLVKTVCDTQMGAVFTGSDGSTNYVSIRNFAMCVTLGLHEGQHIQYVVGPGNWLITWKGAP